MKLRSFPIIAAALVLAAACGGGSPAATAAPGSTAAPGASTIAPPQAGTAPPVGATGAVMHLVVASGPQAGTYDATGVKYDCNTSATGSGASYLDRTVTDGVSSMLFSSGEGGTSVTKFFFQVLFGAISATQPTLSIQTLDPASAEASGTGTLQDNGSTIKWTINGTTADNVGVSATIECGPVDRN